MEAGFSLPPPSALEIHDVNVAEKKKKFRLASDNYLLATELNKKAEKVQVATFLASGTRQSCSTAISLSCRLPCVRTVTGTTHSSHIGIQSCIRCAREILYWPRMTVELKEDIQHCDVCLAHRNKQGKEPLAQHDFAARPWSKVPARRLMPTRRTLLVMSDY